MLVGDLLNSLKSCYYSTAILYLAVMKDSLGIVQTLSLIDTSSWPSPNYMMIDPSGSNTSASFSYSTLFAICIRFWFSACVRASVAPGRLMISNEAADDDEDEVDDLDYF